MFDHRFVKLDHRRPAERSHEWPLAVPGGERRTLGPRREGIAALPGAVTDVLALAVTAQECEAHEPEHAREIRLPCLPDALELLFLAVRHLEIVHRHKHVCSFAR